jgi:diacylglycerol diphosphate phosphatase/phosphatidate phosphatase
MSFPSGHACAAFAGFGFLALYFNAKFGIFGHKPAVVEQEEEKSNAVRVSVKEVPDREKHAGRLPHWRLVLFVAPLLIAVLMAGSKIRDMWHHPVDVVFGACVGTLFALMAYRMVYGSAWDQRTNHLAREVRGEGLKPGMEDGGVMLGGSRNGSIDKDKGYVV